MQLRDLPDDAEELLAKLKAPPRLIAHLTLVHDAAFEIVDSLQLRWPELMIDRDAVLFGSSTHDAGKCLHRNELTGPGNQHETDGPGLLEQYGVSPERSRFARTHGVWKTEPNLAIEDVVVALADTCWKGVRIEELETKLATLLADSLQIEAWEVFMYLDDLVTGIASHAEVRLAWQRTSSE